jgi:hypothetical protein
MTHLVKPKRLKRGDTLATISLSWSGTGMLNSADTTLKTLGFWQGHDMNFTILEVKA